jgi:hypothetical protein
MIINYYIIFDISYELIYDNFYELTNVYNIRFLWKTKVNSNWIATIETYKQYNSQYYQGHLKKINMIA